MQRFGVAAFKAILARRINIKWCKDYENTSSRKESDCMLTFGFKALLKAFRKLNSQTFSAFPKHLETLWQVPSHRFVLLLVVFRRGGVVLLHDYVNVASETYITPITQVTLKTINNTPLLFNRQFNRFNILQLCAP